MLFLIIYISIALMATTGAVVDESSGLCKAIEKSLEYDVNHMCGGSHRELLHVSHASHCGDVVSQAETTDQPTIQWGNAKSGGTYTIAMLDPDAPHGPEAFQPFWVHMIVHGVTGNGLRKGEMDGQVLGKFSYRQPTPPAETGTHRYQFYVFPETPGQSVTTSQTGRGGFSLVQFATENNFCEVVARFEYKVKSPA